MNDSGIRSKAVSVGLEAGKFLACASDVARPRLAALSAQRHIATLHFSARNRGVVRRGGHDLDVASIEASVCTHPDVRAAAVVARPDLYAGEVPVLHVQFRLGGYQSRKDLLCFLADRLPEKQAWPVDLRISLGLPMFPSTAAVYRPALQLLEVERCVREVARATAVGLSAMAVDPVSADYAVAKIGIVSGDVQMLRRALDRYSIAIELD